MGIGDWRLVNPFGDQGGFAEAGGGGDENEFTVQSSVEFFDEMGARDEGQA